MLIINSSDLSYNQTNHEFSSTASYLEKQYPINRIDFEDGKWCLRIKSHKTGNIVKFIRSKEHYTCEGKLDFVTFLGINGLENITLKIYND
jgi:hypothetical protein